MLRLAKTVPRLSCGSLNGATLRKFRRHGEGVIYLANSLASAATVSGSEKHYRISEFNIAGGWLNVRDWPLADITVAPHMFAFG